VIASSSCSVMEVRSGDLFGDDMKDITTTTCSLPPSDLIARSTSSFCKRGANFFLSTCTPNNLDGTICFDGVAWCHTLSTTATTRGLCRFPNRPPAAIDGDTVHRIHASTSRSYPGFHVCPAACGLGKSIYMLTHQQEVTIAFYFL
jgi:hypothetical protein